MSLKTRSISTDKPGFTGDLPPDQFNLARYCLQRSARNYPDKIALVICDDQSNPASSQHWTYNQIETMILKMAGGLLALGFPRGGRIFLRLGNSIDYALLFFAANAAGLVPVPASSQLSNREVALLIEDCGAGAIASDGSLPLPELPPTIKLLDRQLIDDLKDAEPADYCYTNKDDPAFLIYTSGTSFKPKGVLHAQRAVWGRRPMYLDWYDLLQTDRLLHTGAFNWTYTLGTGLFDPWANGAMSIVYTGKKNISIWPQLIEEHQPTIMAAVPSLYRQILKYCDLQASDLSSLRHCLTAGEPQPENIRKKWQQDTSLKLYEALGMSEISTYISTSPTRQAKTGSPGQPQTGRCVAILPEESGTDPGPIGQTGVIAVHRTDPGLMLGYWNYSGEEKQAAYRDDWFISGDLALMDEDGFIWFVGRNDDLINTMGYRVSPVEIEAVLLQHEHIEQVGVCCLNVNENINIITGLLVVAKGAIIDLDEVYKFAETKLAAYKIPKKLLVVDALPCNASGKLLRKNLPLIAGKQD